MSGRILVSLCALSLVIAPISVAGLPVTAGVVLEEQDFPEGATLVSASTHPSKLVTLAATTSYTTSFSDATLGGVALTDVESTAIVAKGPAAPGKLMSSLLTGIRTDAGRHGLLDGARHSLPAKLMASVTSSRPGISGSAQVGQVLDVIQDVWSEGPVQREYAWLRCGAAGQCSPIPGAIYAAYAIGAADRGSAIVVAETALTPSGSGTVLSRPTQVVQ